MKLLGWWNNGKQTRFDWRKIWQVDCVISNKNRSKHGSVIWVFRCDCGAEREIPCENVRSGVTRSCGCLGKSRINTHTVHGKKRHRLYVEI